MLNVQCCCDGYHNESLMLMMKSVLQNVDVDVGGGGGDGAG